MSADLSIAEKDALTVVVDSRVSYLPGVNVWLVDGDGCDPAVSEVLDYLYVLGLVRRPQSWQGNGPVTPTELGQAVAA